MAYQVRQADSRDDEGALRESCGFHVRFRWSAKWGADGAMACGRARCSVVERVAGRRATGRPCGLRGEAGGHVSHLRAVQY